MQLKEREALRGVITGTPFDRAKAQQVAQQVSSVVAQWMENRLELRNQIFHTKKQFAERDQMCDRVSGGLATIMDSAAR